MVLMLGFLFAAAGLLVCGCLQAVSADCSANSKSSINYADFVRLKVFKNNALVLNSTSPTDDLTQVCTPGEPWLVIVPGWTEDCSANTPYIPQLISQFTKYRGGCITCLDYSDLSSDGTLFGYVNLTTNFAGISQVLVTRLQQFQRQKFDASKGMGWAMSFGSRLLIDAGIQFGGKLAEIDVCDPAGPLFYPSAKFQARGPMRNAAKNVQCIHTSADEGTLQRDAHQDWCLGDCGLNQAAAPNQSAAFAFFGQQPDFDFSNLYVPFSKKNHNMCPLLYLSAFDNAFPAIANPCCPPSARDARPAPQNYTMGYRQTNKGRVQQKTLFAQTYALPPYNQPTLVA